MMSPKPRLQDCPANLLIVYTVSADADARGYEPWLGEVDNPFFNAIPGVGNYSNWKIETLLHGDPLPYSHFDFQGLDSEAALEPVWFNADLDEFRKEWIRLWGYGTAKPDPVMANAYLMRPVLRRTGARLPRFARVTASTGPLPADLDADLAWQVDEVIRKHFAVASGADWRVPVTEGNPLALDWLAVQFGDSAEALAAGPVHAQAATAFIARLIAAPE